MPKAYSNVDKPARDYCYRLAQEIVAFPLRFHLVALSLTFSEDKQREISDRRKAELQVVWDAFLGSRAHELHELSAADIAFFLYSNPALQAQMAAIAEYLPSQWLLEQEMAARGIWPPG